MQNIDARFIEAIKNHFTKHGNLDIVKLDTAEVVNTYNLSRSHLTLCRSACALI